MVPFHHGTVFQITRSARAIPASRQKAQVAVAVGSALSALTKPEPPRAGEVFGPGFSSSIRSRASDPPSSGSASGTSPRVRSDAA